MEFRLGRFLTALGLLGVSLPILAGTEALSQNSLNALGGLPNDRLIIKFKQYDSAEIANSKEPPTALLLFQDKHNLRSKILRRLSNGSFVVHMEQPRKGKQLLKFLKQLRDDRDVEYVEPDVRMVAAADPYYSNQWSLHGNKTGIHVNPAWDYATGMDTVVAVLDTGILPHEDLVANTLRGYDFISDQFLANDGNGRDANAADPGDGMRAGECGSGLPESDIYSSWHGSHVAGIIAAEGDNGLGIKGVSYNSKILPLRVLGRCGGYTSDIVDAIYWAAGYSVPGVPDNTTPAQVINLSLTSNDPATCGQAYADAIRAARNKNIAVVAAAGNSASDASNYAPGNCAGVITVAATSKQGGRADYTNFGSKVSVAAPGGTMNNNTDSGGILSVGSTGKFRAGEDSYNLQQGSSMAAPHVSGIAALIKSLNRLASPDQIEQILKSTASPFPTKCSGCGSGIVNAEAAVKQVIGVAPEKPKSATSDLFLNLWGVTEKLQSINGQTGIKYRVRVANFGPDPVESVELKNVLPGNVQLDSIKLDKPGSCDLAAHTCVIDKLESYEAVKLTVIVLTDNVNKMTFSASVSSRNSDPDKSNNSVSRKLGGY